MRDNPEISAGEFMSDMEKIAANEGKNVFVYLSEQSEGLKKVIQKMARHIPTGRNST